MLILFGFGRRDSFGQAAAVVFGEAVFPLQKISDGLRLDAHLDPAEAGQQKIHLPHQADFGTLGLATGLYRHCDFAAFILQQPPGAWQVALDDHSLGNEIEAFAAHAGFRLLAKGLLAVGEKIGARDFALDQDRAAGIFPADHVGCLAAGARLFGEHDAAAIASPQPLFSQLDELLMGHGIYNLKLIIL